MNRPATRNAPPRPQPDDAPPGPPRPPLDTANNKGDAANKGDATNNKGKAAPTTPRPPDGQPPDNKDAAAATKDQNPDKAAAPKNTDKGQNADKDAATSFDQNQEENTAEFKEQTEETSGTETAGIHNGDHRRGDLWHGDHR